MPLVDVDRTRFQRGVVPGLTKFTHFISADGASIGGPLGEKIALGWSPPSGGFLAEAHGVRADVGRVATPPDPKTVSEENERGPRRGASAGASRKYTGRTAFGRRRQRSLGALFFSARTLHLARDLTR